jgi:hypothetical protein
MKNYTIFNPTTGEIVQSGVCSDDDYQHQIISDCQTIEGKSDYKLNYVVNGQIQTYTDVQREAKAAAHPLYFVWSNSSFSWVDPTTPDQQKATQISVVNTKRDNLLSASDWIVVRATDQGTAIPAEWKTYRQALRDIPTQTGYPFNVVWPTSP